MQYSLYDKSQEMEIKLKTVVKSVLKEYKRGKQTVLSGVSGATVNDFFKSTCKPDHKPRINKFFVSEYSITREK